MALALLTVSNLSAQFQVNCQLQACGGLCYSFTSPHPPGTTNLWDFGGGKITATTATTINHCYTDVNTYSNINRTVTVTLSAAGLPSQQRTIDHNNCQEGVFIGAVNGTSYTSLTTYSALPGSGFSGSGNTGNVHCYGPIRIDKDFLFEESNITMSTGAGFIIGVGNNNIPYGLILQNNTTVGVTSGCGCLWRGIELRGGSLWTRNNTVISDALYGIGVRENARLYVEDTRFEDNFIGIYGHGSSVPLRNFTLSGSTFTSLSPILEWCGGDYLLGGEGSSPFFISGGNFEDDRGWAGICLNGKDTEKIGGSAAELNVFENLANGIVLQSASAGKLSGPNVTEGIENCQFNNIQRGDYPADVGGFGISFSDPNGTNYLRQIGFGMSGTPTFEDCEVGVRGMFGFNGHTIFNCSNNRMEGVELGFKALDVQGNHDIDITFNHIVADQFYGNDQDKRGGVYVGLLEHTNGVSINVDDNVIFTNQQSFGSSENLSGVTVESIDFDPPYFSSNVSIGGNEITAQLDGYGIGVYQIDGPSVSYNTVTVPDFNAGSGINNFGSENGFILCNNIFGLAPDNDLAFQAGIWSAFTNNGTVRDNHVTNFDRAYYFDSSTGTVDFGCNDILGNNEYGLRLIGSAIGPQEDKGNIWDCNSSEFEAQHGNATVAVMEQFTANPNTPNAFPAPIAPQNWFDNSSNPTPSCPISPNCPLALNGGVISKLDSTVAQGLLGNMETGYLNNFEKSLYKKLVGNPSIWANNTIMQAFVSANATSPIGQLYDMSLGMGVLFHVPGSAQSQLDVAQIDIATNHSQMDSLETLIAANPPPPDSLLSSYEQQYATLALANAQLDTAMVDVYSDLLDGRSLQADSLLLVNNSINAVDTPDVYKQQVNDIFLRTIGKNIKTATPSQLAILANIAGQCPKVGGRAIMDAIAQYHYFTGIWLPIQECSANVSGGSALNLQQPTSGFSVYPNPSNGDFQIVYEMEKDQKGEVMIYNQSGRLVRRFGLSSSSKRLNVNGLVPGFYHVHLSIDGLVQKVEKLIVH